MSYVKLDSCILDSSLWLDREAREVFITALLMAEPFELGAPTEQLKAAALEPTGYVVPPGWYGFVAASGPGLAHRAGLDRAAGMAALERLSSEEAESRSKDHGGRRLARIDGGFLVLNYVKYREKDHTAAERMRKYRQARKACVTRNGRNAVTPNDVVTRNVTEADANAEAESFSPLRSEKPEHTHTSGAPVRDSNRHAEPGEAREGSGQPNIGQDAFKRPTSKAPRPPAVSTPIAGSESAQDGRFEPDGSIGSHEEAEGFNRTDRGLSDRDRFDGLKRRLAERPGCKGPAGTGRTIAARPDAVARAGGHCEVCSARGEQVDHIVPRSKGGADLLENLQLLCARCHWVKSHWIDRKRLGFGQPGDGRPPSPAQGRAIDTSSPEAEAILQAMLEHRALAEATGPVADALWGLVMTKSVKLDWVLDSIHAAGAEADLALADGKPFAWDYIRGRLRVFVSNTKAPRESGKRPAYQRPEDIKQKGTWQLSEAERKADEARDARRGPRPTISDEEAARILREVS